MIDFENSFKNSKLPYVLGKAKTLSKKECESIYNYMKEYKPHTILEFGVQFGCSSKAMLDMSRWLKLNTSLHSWDTKKIFRYVEENEFTFHHENVTEKEPQCIDKYKPDLLFIDAHHYPLVKNLIKLCLQRKINFIIHDTIKSLVDNCRENSNNFTDTSKPLHWEIVTLGQLVSEEIWDNDYYENDTLIVKSTRDRFGISIVTFK